MQYDLHTALVLAMVLVDAREIWICRRSSAESASDRSGNCEPALIANRCMDSVHLLTAF